MNVQGWFVTCYAGITDLCSEGTRQYTKNKTSFLLINSRALIFYKKIKCLQMERFLA